MKFGKYILIACLLLTYFSNFAQNKQVDSLWAIYNNPSQIDTNRLIALHKVIKKINVIDLDSSIVLIEKELKKTTLFQKEKNKKWLAKIYDSFGNSFDKKDNFQKALEYYFKSLEIYENIRDIDGMGTQYNNIGIAYNFLANYPKELDYNLKALKAFEKTGNKEDIGMCYNNLGVIFNRDHDYKKALNYYFKSLKIKEEFKDTFGMGICYQNIANTYHDLYDYDKALKYNEKCLEITKKINDVEGLGMCYSNMGIIFSDQNKNEKALEFYLKSLKVKEKIDDKKGLVTDYINIGVLFNKTKKHELALKNGLMAVKLAASIGDIEGELLGYQILSKAYAQTARYKEAYESHVKFKQLTDSIFNGDNSKQLSDLKTNYEVEKKEAELKVKADAMAVVTAEEKKRQQLIIYAVAGVLVIVMAFSVLLYKRFRLTNKQKQIIELKEQETQKQNELITIQKHLVEEKHREITDSINYAERIQRSFLATKELLDENLRDYFILFRPKAIVSGDFYWASYSKASAANGNRNLFYLATADSTGHGVPGAIMSLLNITSIEGAIHDGYNEPADILNATRKTIIERLKKDGSEEGGKDGMDCSLTVYDFENKKLIVSAANNPVWINRGKELIEIQPDKMPVGKHDKQSIPFTQHEFDLQAGDIVYTLTDGYPDQFGGEKGKKFMSKNLKEFLINNAHLPMSEQKNILEKTFVKWQNGLEQIDDVTIIGIKI